MSPDAARTATASSIALKHRNAYLAPSKVGELPLRLHYIECQPASQAPIPEADVILLIHGFPQTSYQFRNVMIPLAQAGYQVIAPDYRGAGESSRPTQGYDKVTLASDLHRLLTTHLGITSKVHLVGHDIGAMIAYAYATGYPHDTASIVWGECPLPGSEFYDRCRYGVDKFHFTFHCVPDGLPEALVAGRERLYLKQFFDRQLVRTEGVWKQDFEHYVHLYSLPDAMRAAFDVYRAFSQDKERNIAHREKNGKSTLPNLILSGALSDHAVEARAMAEEFFEHVQEAVVEESAHYVAEENPESFVEATLTFIDSIGQGRIAD